MSPLITCNLTYVRSNRRDSISRGPDHDHEYMHECESRMEHNLDTNTYAREVIYTSSILYIHLLPTACLSTTRISPPPHTSVHRSLDLPTPSPIHGHRLNAPHFAVSTHHICSSDHPLFQPLPLQPSSVTRYVNPRLASLARRCKVFVLCCSGTCATL